MTNRSMNSVDLEGSLRRALRLEIEASPMPGGLLDIPGSWVRPRSRLGSTLSLGAAAVLGALLGGSVVAAVATQSGWLAPTVTLRDASVIAGIPLERMVRTEDGFVGVRGPTTEQATVAVVFVPSGGGPTRVLVQRAVPGFGYHQPTHVLETLSCAPSAGLQQPDYIFGYEELYGSANGGVTAGKGGPAFAVRVDPVIGHGAVADGAFVYVLDLPPPATFDVRLTGGTPPGDWEAVIPNFDGVMFNHLDGCAG